MPSYWSWVLLGLFGVFYDALVIAKEISAEQVQ